MVSNLITERELMDICLRSVPEFKLSLKEFRADWSGEKNLEGLEVAELSHFTREEFIKKNNKVLFKVFLFIEKCLKNGNKTVKNYIYFMFIENISNEYKGYTEEDLKAYLGPLSKKAYDRINAFWMEGKPIDSLD